MVGLKGMTENSLGFQDREVMTGGTANANIGTSMATGQV